MFYRHKYKALQRRMAEAHGRIDTQRKYIRDLEAQIGKLREDLKTALAASDKLPDVTAERNKLFEENIALMKANNNLKRDMDREIRQKAELGELLADTQKKLSNAEWREQHWNAGHGYSTQVRFFCPVDCTKHANPGPGGSVCQNCIRNPHAVDKYSPEKGRYQDWKETNE